MTEPVQVALIAVAGNVAVVLLSRLWSRKEHRATSEKVDDMHRILSSGKQLREITKEP